MRKGLKVDHRTQTYMILAFAIGLYILITIRLGGITINDIYYSIYGLMFFRFDLITGNIIALATDVGIAVLGSYLWLAFFGQFVLPVKELEERKNVVARLISAGGRGPTLFIRNSQVIEDPEKKGRKGAGVIILDSASAAVLHNQSSYTRAVGPGLVFTEYDEGIAGTIDLHTQVRQIGPSGDEECPYADKGEKESDEQYSGRQERRMQTSGLTRDGVEVVPNIEAIFCLDANPDEGNTPFGYRPESVWRSIAHEAIDPGAPSDTDSRRVPWDWPPVNIAADLWREYLRKFTLTELFDFSPETDNQQFGEDRQTVFESIVVKINDRMKNALVDELDDVGNITGRRLSSREYRIIRERGLKIINVSVNNLHLETSVEGKFVKSWKATWLNRAKGEADYIERRNGIEKFKGQVTAQKEFANTIVRPLYDKLIIQDSNTKNSPNTAKSVELLIHGTLNAIIRNPKLHHQLEEEETGLVETIEWIRKHSNGKNS